MGFGSVGTGLTFGTDVGVVVAAGVSGRSSVLATRCDRKPVIRVISFFVMSNRMPENRTK